MILHILPTFDIESSGPSYSVSRLCEAMLAAGTPTKLAVTALVPGREVRPYVIRFPLGYGPRRLRSSPTMARWLLQQVRDGALDILHDHGLWTMPNVYSGRARRAGNVRLVVSPHGMVSKWAWNHHSGRKWVMWHFLGQGRAMHAADGFHATSEEECGDLRRLGFRQPVCVLPHGIDVPSLAEKPAGQRKTLLYLGRIHKIKGIDLLLKAWAVVEPRFPEWDLVVAGPDEGSWLAQCKVLAARLKLKRVSFPGPVYGQQKLALYRSAHLYVLPTHSENFAMTVAEALAAGTPAIVTRGAPWAGLVDHGAGWWIEIGVEPLVAALQEALSQPDECLIEMGRRGRQWMARDFSWETIGQAMAKFYRWLREGGPAPAYVRID